MKDDFIVPLNGLAQGRTDFRWSAGKEFFERFENSEILDAGLDVETVVEKTGRSIVMDGVINGSVTVVCDRCLSELAVPVRTGFSLDLKFTAGGSEDPEGERESVFLSAGEMEFNLSQVVYDYVCLSLPVQRVHEEGGCDPGTIRFLSSEDETESLTGDVSSPFAGLKDLLEKKER